MIVGLSEWEGAIANPKGLDVAAVMKHRAATRKITGFPGATDLPGEDALFLDCDILVPAALENVITARERVEGPREDHRRGRERPDHGRRRRDPPSERRLRHPRHVPQRGRRHRVVLRMAEEPLARALRADGEALRGDEGRGDGEVHRGRDGQALVLGRAKARDSRGRGGGPRQLGPRGDDVRRVASDPRRAEEDTRNRISAPRLSSRRSTRSP